MQVGIDIPVPFVEHLGIYLIDKTRGEVTIGIKDMARLRNSWGSLHGGVTMTLLDVALATAGRSLDEGCIGAVTIELKTNFISSARGTLTAIGRSQRAGRSLIFSEGEVLDESRNAVAKGSGTFKLLYPRT